MKSLRLPIAQPTFAELAELGRSTIPTVTPGWTDHNVHDPGITIVELLAWIAEAQIYSLARLRTDERRAYARLLGLEPDGPGPALGLVWPLAGVGASQAPPVPWTEATVVKEGTAVTGDRPESPTFFTTDDTALTAAWLVKIETRFANGSSRDWTRTTAREGATFVPFGTAPVPGDRLILWFLDPTAGATSGSVPFTIGFEIVNQAPRRAIAIGARPRLRVSLIDEEGERPVELVEDTTGGLLQTGLLRLRLDKGATPRRASFGIVVQSPTGGFLRSPLVRRIAANVLRIRQAKLALQDVTGTGRPGQTIVLAESSLIAPAHGGSFKLWTTEDDTRYEWGRVDDLARSEPNDRHFELDRAKGVVAFGNGLNGRAPPPDAAIHIEYRVCEGSRGNLPKGVTWQVRGIGGDFGITSQPTTGGRDAQSLAELRAVVRDRSRNARPIVTGGDLVRAALEFVDLGVTRAIELPTGTGPARVRGNRVLMVVGPPAADTDAAPAATMEAPEFLAEVRARLAPRLPLGQRVEIAAPRYLPLRIQAKLVATPNTDPAAVAAKAGEVLEARLARVATPPASPWPFGRDVTETAVKGWLRKVEGVARVVSVRLLVGDRGRADSILELGPTDLPDLQLQTDDIVVERPPLGGRP